MLCRCASAKVLGSVLGSFAFASQEKTAVGLEPCFILRTCPRNRACLSVFLALRNPTPSPLRRLANRAGRRCLIVQQLYEVLGVRPGAGDTQIKAAFRSLAKQLHPDLNPGDVDADQRLRAIIRAYQTLSDPPSRAAYDTHLARQRSLRRWRLSARGTTMLVMFALTVATGLYWREVTGALLGGHIGARPPATDKHSSDAEGRRPSTLPSPDRSPDELVAASPPDPDPGKGPSRFGADTGPHATVEGRTPVVSPPSEADPPVFRDAAPQEAVPLQTSAVASAQLPPSKTDDGWASYRDARFGFALEYPFEVFPPDPEPSNEGKSFVSRDGRARLMISAAVNAKGLTLAQHRRSLMEGAYKSATFDYAPRRGTWFVLSGTLGTDMFYHRVTFACDGQTFHGWRLMYPLSERAIYDRIVEEVHRRYRHEGGTAGCAR
jgi:DnaJ domain